MSLSDVAAAFFDVSLERANQFYTWGWRGSLFGAFVTAVAVGFLMWGTRVRDRDFENQMTNLNLEAGQARERAGRLEERAAGLENETAQARLEQERLKQQLAWRTLSPPIAAQLRARLAEQPHSYLLAYTSNDPEAIFLAIQFSRVFDEAHWTLAGAQSRTYSSAVVFGITIPGPENEATSLLRTALAEAHMPFSTETLPPWNSMQGSSGDADVTIMIGSKPPPF